MSDLPNEMKRGSNSEHFLQYGEDMLSLVVSHTLQDDIAHIYRVAFDPDFTYNVGYIYIIEHSSGNCSRSVRYYRDSEEAEKAAFSIYKEDI